MKRNVLAIIALVVLLIIVSIWETFAEYQRTFDASRQLLAHTVCVGEVRKEHGSQVEVFLSRVERQGATWIYQGDWRSESSAAQPLTCTVAYDGWHGTTPSITLR